MKFTSIFFTVAMAAASAQALTFQFGDSDLTSRSLQTTDDFLYARSDILLDFTTRELVQELESRMNLAPRGGGGLLSFAKDAYHRATGNKSNKHHGGSHHGGGSHPSHDTASSSTPGGGMTDPAGMGAGGGGLTPDMSTGGTTTGL